MIPEAKMTSPSKPEYAYIELFGHTRLGPCVVREVVRYGVTMCEARPLGLDGEPGPARRFPGTAIYSERELTEEEARRLAMPVMLPARVESVSEPPGPPCKTCGYGVCDCSDAERDGKLAGEEKMANAELDADEAEVPLDDGTPLCEPITGEEDDIPF
jgi:hypothetical protein